MGKNKGTITGYVLGYVIKKSAGKPNIGPGIGQVKRNSTAKVYVGRGKRAK